MVQLSYLYMATGKKTIVLTIQTYVQSLGFRYKSLTKLAYNSLSIEHASTSPIGLMIRSKCENSSHSSVNHIGTFAFSLFCVQIEVQHFRPHVISCVISLTLGFISSKIQKGLTRDVCLLK